MQLGTQEQRGCHRHEHGQEEAEDVQEGIPLHQHKLSLHTIIVLVKSTWTIILHDRLLQGAKQQD